MITSFSAKRIAVAPYNPVNLTLRFRKERN
jgi:hypothetical protein